MIKRSIFSKLYHLTSITPTRLTSKKFFMFHGTKVISYGFLKQNAIFQNIQRSINTATRHANYQLSLNFSFQMLPLCSESIIKSFISLWKQSNERRKEEKNQSLMNAKLSSSRICLCSHLLSAKNLCLKCKKLEGVQRTKR